MSPLSGTVEKGVLAGEGLTLWRGTTCLFEALAFGVAPGSALLIEGANGAGKTSLLRVIGNLVRPDDGVVTWRGTPVHECLRDGQLRMAVAGHSLGLKTELTTLRNLEFYARVSGLGRQVGAVLEQVGLTACADLEVRVLSAGQRRRAALARVLLSNAELWLLDEPQTNLDAAGRGILEDAIRRHLAQGGTAVISAHQSIDLHDAPLTRLVLGGSQE